MTNILWIPALITNISFENRKRKEFKILDYYHGPFWMQQSQGHIYHENIEDTQTTMEQVTAIQVTCILQKLTCYIHDYIYKFYKWTKASHFSACLEIFICFCFLIFKKIPKTIRVSSKAVLIQIRINILWVLICVQTVHRSYQQEAKVVTGK